METEFEKDEFEKAVRKILWAIEPLPRGEQRILALKEALERLRTVTHDRSGTTSGGN